VLQKNTQCQNCKQPFVFSSLGYEILPLVEFSVEAGLAHGQVLSILKEDKKRKQDNAQFDGWSQSQNNMRRSFTKNIGTGFNLAEVSLFERKLNDVCDLQMSANEYIPIVLDQKILSSLTENEVPILI